MELFTLFLVGLSLLLVYMLFRRREADDNLNLPPGCMGLPIIGNTFQFALKKVRIMIAFSIS